MDIKSFARDVAVRTQQLPRFLKFSEPAAYLSMFLGPEKGAEACIWGLFPDNKEQAAKVKSLVEQKISSEISSEPRFEFIEGVRVGGAAARLKVCDDQ